MAFRIDPASNRSSEILNSAQLVVDKTEQLRSRDKEPGYRPAGILIRQHLQATERLFIRGDGFNVRSAGVWTAAAWDKGVALQNIEGDKWGLAVSLKDVRKAAFKFFINDDPSRCEQGENHTYRDMVLMNIDRYPTNTHHSLLKNGISILDQDLANPNA